MDFRFLILDWKQRRTGSRSPIGVEDRFRGNDIVLCGRTRSHAFVAVCLGLVIAALGVFASDGYCETVSGAVRKGNSLYTEGKYEEALKEYQAAQVESPDNERIMFNLGDAQYKLKKYDGALSDYLMATQNADPKIRAQSHYNAGNALYRMGKLEDAVEQYLKALENDPNDEDAKYNLEFVQQEIRRRMNEQQKRQQEQSKKGQEKQESKAGKQDKQDTQDKQSGQQAGGQEQNPQQKESQQEKKEEQAGGQEKEGQAGGQEEAEQQQQAGAPEQDGQEQAAGSQEESMDKGNVQRWLDAVEAESTEKMKEFLRKQQPKEVVGHQKDW